ncbi:hypothetical protein ACJ73_04916 [Blastomyces percursus]|uniref:Uncharacterized protein n=1 Tax=Blastomyces percursus TaxID=1658174 RepID=A0A1J9Q6N7_9EURO|nr:hypothetical protein ACJ73_04916 [Blastomyces percursus]
MAVDLDNITFHFPQSASLPKFNAPRAPHTNLPNKPYSHIPPPSTLPLPPPAPAFASIPMTAPAPAPALTPDDSLSAKSSLARSLPQKPLQFPLPAKPQPLSVSTSQKSPIPLQKQGPQGLEMLHGSEFDKAFKNIETLDLTAVESSVCEDDEIQRQSQADGAAAGHANFDVVDREEASDGRSTVAEVDCSVLVSSNTRRGDVFGQPITIDSDGEDDGDCRSKTRATPEVGFDKKISFPADEDDRASPQSQRRESGHMIKEEEGEKQRSTSPERTQHRMVAVEIPAIPSCSPPAFSRDPGTAHDEEATKRPTLDIGNNPSHDGNECSENDDEDDEGDEDYTVSEDESEAGDRAPKRQRRISRCSTGNSKEGHSRSPAKSAASAQNAEGCASPPASQKDRHGSAKSHTNVNRLTLPIEDIVMLTSEISTVVFEWLRDYSAESGEIVAYSKREHLEPGRSTKGYEERLRDGGSRLRRWSKEEDERLLAMVSKGRPWGEIENHFPQRTPSSLRQRASVLRKVKKRKRA